MTVISDSSVLMNLAVIGQLELLPAIFQKIIIPQTVYDEVVIQGAGKPGSKEIKNAIWIQVETCADLTLLNRLLQLLDRGEAEAITLAFELHADLLIIDERRGRAIASGLQIPVTGLLGVLLSAKQKQLIHSVREWMERLRTDADFRISKVTFQKVLNLAGE